ncbi:MAG: hypothetical protein RL226_598 [Bacteroidota bacterium]|jgi:UDP-N-acetylmuramate dehydrogenase
MTRIRQGVSLRPFHTFGVSATAEWFSEAATVAELQELVEYTHAKQLPLLVLGGGSNVLFTHDPAGMVLLNRIGGIDVVSKTENEVFVRVGAGEVWHSFVMHCIREGWCGVENLALIPGSVGASPMQNIGAYGVELESVFYQLEALHIPTGETHFFSKDDCQFGYRESVFKRGLKGQYIITHVTFRLQLQPSIRSTYGAIEKELERMEVVSPGIRDIAEAVMAIRRSKLPDPKVLGNAGSFFKNPVVPQQQFLNLIADFPDMPHYDAGSGQQKLAAGWLIEQCGWKGRRIGDCGVHVQQALVLVNYGQATGEEVFLLSQMVMDDVADRFGVYLEREVNIIGI